MSSHMSATTVEKCHVSRHRHLPSVYRIPRTDRIIVYEGATTLRVRAAVFGSRLTSTPPSFPRSANVQMMLPTTAPSGRDEKSHSPAFQLTCSAPSRLFPFPSSRIRPRHRRNSRRPGGSRTVCSQGIRHRCVGEKERGSTRDPRGREHRPFEVE
ncbi:uncharacterized protein EI97DRAFT_64236 [Westerdykella ornata]|uniref:Uncharacterized protein n=1 Tax=Westerdykella ornata TaxID=318751 RepID=A0A6A6JH82_WESOR|nr:uncharacterized protein EI97DRAFT_64236 [Westerdykella ornata]KAF2275564.1 hypothetical protein EI97DRAFT_64236 [Westerdykella ornata]